MEFLTINGYNIIFIVVIAFLVSAALVPAVKKIAFHVNAYDEPNARKVHQKAMPALGGLAIFGSFMIGYMLFAYKNDQMLSILMGGFIMILTGMIDDIKPIRARYKLVGQTIAASIVVLYGNVVLQELTAFGFVINFGIFAQPITIIFILGLTNAINLIDGLDGLAAGISSIYFLTISIIAFILNQTTGLDVILSLIMLGATLGFLLYNFSPATIFVGDTGSLFLGFMISVIALLGFKSVTLTSLIIPVVILAIPILDTLMAIIRRLLKGNNIAVGDREHLHHQLLKMKYSIRKTVLIIYGINILFSAVSIFYVLGDNRIAICIYAFLMILLLIFVLKTNILFDHQKKTTKKVFNKR